MRTIRAVYIGDHFYWESGTMMSSIYLEDGTRWDFGKLKLALARGDEVNIRQANDSEIGRYERKLRKMKEERSCDEGDKK